MAGIRKLPLLAILDLMLPDVSGEQVIQDLKALGDVPVIILTSRSSEEDRAPALAEIHAGRRTLQTGGQGEEEG